MNPPNIPQTKTKPSEVDSPEISTVTNFATALEALLRNPAALFIAARKKPSLLIPFYLVVMVCVAVFGLVLGSFSGGEQFWAAPLKTVGGLIIAATICFPSFYIFSCLANAPLQLRGLSAAYLAFLALLSLLLIAFAPVLWIFAQSSDSIAFVGSLSILVWLLSFLLASGMLRKSAGSRGTWQVHLWLLIFLAVSLQMSTAIRPLLGSSDDFLPKEKRFFLTHWVQTLDEDVSDSRDEEESAIEGSSR